jgi:ribosome-associated heat shock protein Hsp15
MDEEDGTWQRLDKFLFFARLCKTRAAAATIIESGSVRINRLPTAKAHARLRPADIVTLALPRGVLVIRILSLAKRRGPAVEARSLYEELP